MNLILTIFIHLTLFWVLCAWFLTVWVSMLRVKVTAVSLYHGPTPLKFMVGGCPVSIGWIPMGSSVSFDPAEFQRRAWPVRILTHISAPVIGLGLAMLLLGIPDASHHFLTGFRQIAEGAWEPIAQAGGHLKRWQQVAEISPVKAFGIIAAKAAAMLLFPVGGGVLTQILADVGSSSGKESLEKLAMFNAMIGMMIFALWSFAALWLVFAG